MSRKCRICGNQFRPSFSQQMFCLPCWRLSANTDPKEVTMSTTSTEPEPIDDDLFPDDAPTPVQSKELVRRDPVSLFELDQRRAHVYATSGYWPDAKSQAQALVKIEAGRELGLPAIVAMSEVHVIQGKPTLGAGALAALVKQSGRYDYRIVDHTEQRCAIRFFDLQAGELGESVFTLDDARKAGLASRSTWRQYPRNMLFARALSNGVAWYCPDVSAGRVYTPDELDGPAIVETDLVENEAIEGEAVEEMPADEPDTATVASDGEDTIPAEAKATSEQWNRITELLRQLAEQDEFVDWPARAKELCGGIDGSKITAGVASLLIDKLEAELKEER